MQNIEENEPSIEKKPILKIDNLPDDKLNTEDDLDQDYLDPNMRSHNWLQQSKIYCIT